MTIARRAWERVRYVLARCSVVVRGGPYLRLRLGLLHRLEIKCEGTPCSWRDDWRGSRLSRRGIKRLLRWCDPERAD